MKMHPAVHHLQNRILPNVIILMKLSEVEIILGITNTPTVQKNMSNIIPHVLETIKVLLGKSSSNVRLVVKDILTEVI
jgi:hypothetical protein